FPRSDRYHLHVIGDGLATGLADGLEQAFKKDNTLKVINSTHGSASLTRPRYVNWSAMIDKYAEQSPMHIAVVMMGINDVRKIRTNKGNISWGSDGWRDAYAKEVDNLIKILKSKNVAVYWMGLPVMAKPKYSEHLAFINSIIRERAYVNNIKFIDSWSGFVDQNGDFTSYGPDLTGQNRRLRQNDGISFTRHGNRKLASYVEVLVRRDLNEARAERNIPLAGDEDEQSALLSKPQAGEDNDVADAAEQASEATDKDADSAGKTEERSGETPAQNTPSGGSDTAGQADKSASQTASPRTPAFLPGNAPHGETILGDIDNGVTSLATVSSMTDLNAGIAAGERRLPVTERLYYRVVVKGESLKSQPNRADDFKWPSC
ncbi:MAG: DUF459 domain-containing protein, partial [Alphaproteobacteria bacterium]